MRWMLWIVQVSARDLLRRHQHGDWGNVPPSDAEENDRSVTSRCRILSSYPLNEEQNIWMGKLNENTQSLPVSAINADRLFIDLNAQLAITQHHD